MYLAQITLFSVLCVISEQSTFDKSSQSITDITVHTIPGATTVVKFDRNSITFVQSNYFKNLLNLDVIWLQYNAITDIADGAFAQVPTVTEIVLSKNQLTVIREMMFSGLPNLTTLRLYANQIHTIEPGCFKDSTALTRIGLAQNSLQNVPRCMFDLDHHPTSLDHFYIYYNPLRCDQDLCWLKQLDMTWITVGATSNTRCARPTGLAGRKWDTLTEMDVCTTPGKRLT